MKSDFRRHLEDPISSPREALTFAGPLVVSLVGLVPALAFVGRAAGAGLMPSLLVALALVGIGYLAFVYVRHRLVAGAYVAFFVLSTFSANLPIGASEQFFRLAPGSLGPQVWLYQGPLVVVVGYLLWTRRFTIDSITRTELVLGAFVVWTLLSAVFGSGPRTDMAIFFTWLMVQAWVVLAVVRRGVEHGFVSLESVVTTYIVTVLGHVAFAGVQVLHQEPIGLTFLGEAITWHSGISYPLLGIQTQLIPSGFTGHGYVLVGLILLTFPAMLWFTYYSDSIPGMAALGIAILSVVFLRLSTSDAGRGAFIVIAVSLVVGVALLSWGTGPERFGSVRDLWSGIRNLNTTRWQSPFGLLIAVLVTLSPSSKSGSSSDVQGPVDPSRTDTTPTDTTPTETTVTPTEPPGSPTTTPETPTGTPTPAEGPVAPDVTDISIPLFDLTNLGTRIQQAVVGLDMFSRNPLFGVGGGNYRFVASTYGVPDAPHLPVPLTLHNVYILLLAETGLLGFLLYMGAVGLVALAGLRSVLDGNKPSLHLCLLVSFVGYFAFLFFTHLIDQANSLLPFWALAACIVGEQRANQPDGAATTTPADD